MDTIGNFITIIRNAGDAGRETCSDQFSNIKEGIAKILLSEGFINNFRIEEDAKGLKRIVIELKYFNDVSVIEAIKRVSKPSRRIYVKATEVPKVLGGMGRSILSTSRGVLSDKDALKQNVGGELLCKVW